MARRGGRDVTADEGVASAVITLDRSTLVTFYVVGVTDVSVFCLILDFLRLTAKFCCHLLLVHTLYVINRFLCMKLSCHISSFNT